MTKQNSHSFLIKRRAWKLHGSFWMTGKWPDQIDGVLNHPELSNPWKISVPVEQVEPFPSSVPESYSHVEEREDEFILLNILLGFVLIAMAAWAYGRSRQPQALYMKLASICMDQSMCRLLVGIPCKPNLTIQ